ncbi:MAG: hypothetical protein CMJ20_00295 [Phycisphaeraceae bacterium]|nr:hypothetical protein [Phycisphaeraceae bacterium]|tara:strand:- start:448 stop:1224 length:777 start_codon:yes stop_codon:yes gene_type:complete
MSEQRVPILVYHHVYPDDMLATCESLSGIIGQSEFQRQMEYIAQEGWQVISMTAVLDWLTRKRVVPDRAVAMNFDNGWLDTRTVTMPIMQEFGMKATCYVITDGLEAASAGRSQSVRTQTEGVVERPFMDWDHARELLDANWEIGAHTATHCKMTDKHAAGGDQAVLWEIETSNAIIEKRLGLAVDHFAYPSGSRSIRIDELLAPYYRSLRLWHCEFPIQWSFTDHATSRLAIDCQNVDARVSFEDFKRIFTDAQELQ